MDEKQLRELQLKSLETLKEFIKFCDDNFLTYYLIGGCLIGAVRSGGFLPWDDDIDVFMPRSDYERLWQMWDSSGRFKLLRTTENVYTRSQFMTLCDTETTCVRELTKDLPIPQGITMDIIPLDGCPLSRIKRRRECPSCGKRFTTYEVIDNVPIAVVKRDGRRESFDRSKVDKSIRRACGKRPVSDEQIRTMIDNVVANLDGDEVPSEKIAELVMSELHKVDEVAYIRFASVYRRFQDVRSFIHEIEQFLEEK